MNVQIQSSVFWPQLLPQHVLQDVNVRILRRRRRPSHSRHRVPS